MLKALFPKIKQQNTFFHNYILAIGLGFSTTVAWLDLNPYNTWDEESKSPSYQLRRFGQRQCSYVFIRVAWYILSG